MQDARSELERLAHAFDPSKLDLLDESMDPWGSPYQASSIKSAWMLWSLGPDGDEGTEDDLTLSVPDR